MLPVVSLVSSWSGEVEWYWAAGCRVTAATAISGEYCRAYLVVRPPSGDAGVDVGTDTNN